MNNNALHALAWIGKILNDNNIEYCLGGGTAVHLLGSGREINDIDISSFGKDFPKLLPLVKEYIVIGPKHYVDEKWDCVTLSLNFNGQDIDLTDRDSLLMRSLDDTEWIKNKDIYEKWPYIYIEVEGVPIAVMNPKALLTYKKHLSGSHQDYDRTYLEKVVDDVEFERQKS